MKPTANHQLPTTARPLKVAIVHDWLVGGGAERVVLELHRIFPDAPIYTSYSTATWRKKLDYRVMTGPLQYWPFSILRKFIPILRIWWFSRLDLSDFDLVISSSGAEAKGIKINRHKTDDGKWAGPLHVNYCHAPTHYYWSRYEEYMQNPGFGLFDPIARIGLKLLVGPLRKWDYRAAQRPDYIIANSSHTQNAIKKYYGRNSVVIHPPVDTDRFSPSVKKPRQGFVVAGRQTPYKRIDLAVAACTELGLPLTVIGNGPDYKKLIKMAGPSVNFITNASDEAMAFYFQTAEAFIFPGIDDFGIVAVEAMSAGTPVIAYQAGGALDYVTERKTGLFFSEQNVESLVEVLRKFNGHKFAHDDIKRAAQRFSTPNFHKNLRQELKRILQ